MEKQAAIWIQTDHDHPVTPTSGPEFLRLLKLGLLLALREQGILNDFQLRMALAQLGIRV